MSEYCDNINTAIGNSIDCQSAMLHAFDIPMTSRQLNLIESVVQGTFRFSVSKDNGEFILGFENIANGNRVVFNYGDVNIDTPKWLGEDFHVVTTDSSSRITEASLRGDTPADRCIVCIISLDSVWMMSLTPWLLRVEHSTGAPAEILTDYLPLMANTGFIGGLAIMRANGRITADTLANVDFKSASMAKTVLGRAGRSKPQGDLIVYFSKDSCAAEGYNSQGDTTLELGPIGGSRQIEAYESEIEEDNIMGVKFNYPFYFRKLFSSREGVLSDPDVDIKLSKISYGVTPHGRPHVKVDLGNGLSSIANMCVEFILESEGIFIPDNFEMPELRLSNKPVRSPRVRVEPVEETKLATSADLNLDNFPEEHRENILKWFSAHIESNPTNKEDIDVDISKWFTSYMMKCARQGVAITVSDRDTYREVTNLVN